MGDPVPLTDAPTANDNIATLLNAAHTESESDEHLSLEQDSQLSTPTDPREVTHHPLSGCSRAPVQQQDQPSPYNFSMEGSDYVQLFSLLYSDSGDSTNNQEHRVLSSSETLEDHGIGDIAVQHCHACSRHSTS